MTKPTTTRSQRAAAGLTAVLAHLTASQALTVSAWEADNLAAAAKLPILPVGRPRKPRPTECTCQGGEA
jgi:hypothetical protein